MSADTAGLVHNRSFNFRGVLHSVFGRSNVAPTSVAGGVSLQASLSPSPVQAIFPDARHTNIRNATFNIYPGTPAAGIRSPQDAGGPLSSERGTTSSTVSSSPPTPPSSTVTELPSPASISSTLSSSIIVSPSPPTTPMTSVDIPSLSPSCDDAFPVPETSPEIYTRCLIGAKRGYPLWIPSPNMRLPAAHRIRGINIGDVGAITPEGGFLFFFNVLHDATHSSNTGMILPPGFVPFKRIGPYAIFEHKESSGGSYLADASVKRVDAAYDDTSKTVLKTSAPYAGILTMPEAVYHAKLHNHGILRNYISEHLVSWYRFIREELGYGIENGDLRVVYARRNTSGWGIATASNGSVDFPNELTFSVDEELLGRMGCKYRWHHRGSAETKVGPSLDEHEDILPLISDQASPNNQCLFISTLDYTLAEDEWALIDPTSSLPAVTSPSATNVDNARASGSIPASFSVDRDAGSHGPSHTGSYTGASQLARNMTESESLTLTKPFHPSNIIARNLLGLIPEAKSVAVVSDNWEPYFTDDITDASSLIDRVLHGHCLVLDSDGCLVLCARTEQIDTLPQYGYFLELLADALVGSTWRVHLPIGTAISKHAVGPSDASRYDIAIIFRTGT